MDTSRRNFLKASTATGLLAMTYAPGTLGAVGAKALEGGDKTVYSFCEMCSSRAVLSRPRSWTAKTSSSKATAK